jgi:hypothetical protein
MKNFKIKLNVKPIWMIGKGHNTHLSGSGKHDNRPNRLRTRRAINNQKIKEFE